MQHRKHLYRELFNSEAGKTVLKDLTDRYFNQMCLQISTDGQNSALSMAYREGQRALMNDIIKLMQEEK